MFNFSFIALLRYTPHNLLCIINFANCLRTLLRAWNVTFANHLIVITNLIMNMKKFLDCDWLREMQFLGNTVQKKGNWVQKRVTNVTFWLANKQRNSLRANQMRHLNGAKFGSAPAGPVSSKNRSGWRLQHICFCDRNNCRRAEKLL